MAPQTYQLVMRTGPTPGKVFPLDQDEIRIGRDISNDITISDAEVSRHHSRLIVQGNSFVLEDQGSTNGTFVDGQRLVGPHRMRAGEVVFLGENVSLAFEPTAYEAGAVPAAPAIESQYQSSRWPEPERTPERVEPAPAPAAQPGPEAQAPRPEVYEPGRPVYAGSVPPGPVGVYPPAEEKQDRRWLYAGCGCLLLLACLIAAGAVTFDTLNLYCTPPFNVLFACP
jgi:predicted component of type VI protein secretion system